VRRTAEANLLSGQRRHSRLKALRGEQRMNFLKTLFWVVVAVSLAIFATRNWNDVIINLWGSIQADIKLPVLLLLTFLVGFLPPYLILRGRIWGLRRKLTLAERPAMAPVPASPAPLADDEEDAG
jgi:putative membrane protein